jgi:peptide/nickel transport system substrate-binding protein
VYWTNEYIGAGPYKLTSWQHGIELDGAAFDGHVLGRPKIDKIVERIMDDENSIMANVLSGEIQYASRTTLRFNHGQTLKSQWVSAGRGRTINDPTAALFNQVQFRPEYLGVPALADVRVRRALLWGIDKPAIIDALYDGESSVADTFISRQTPYYAEVERAVTKTAYDPRQVEQRMGEAGFTKDRDGLFANAAGERFRLDFQVLNSVDYERVGQVMTDSWRRAGVDVALSVLPNELVRVNEVRHTFSGINMPGSGVGAERDMMLNFISAQIGTPGNRWGGSNRGGWSSPQYDAAFDAYNRTLDPTERHQAVAQAMKILGDEAPAFPLYYNIYVLAIDAALNGPTSGAPATTDYWNVHEWYWSQ